jgi:hypothetical protein
MFDPTAFENMKVVLEGAIYDKEFDGEAAVTNRKDIVNLSALSRQYELEIMLPEKQALKASILLEADLENLASEIFGSASGKAGCTVAVAFTIPNPVKEKEATQLIGSLEEIWGKERTITVNSTLRYSNGAETCAPYSVASVSFGRLVKEEQMDDLLIMANYMIDSLWMLEKLQK